MMDELPEDPETGMAALFPKESAEDTTECDALSADAEFPDEAELIDEAEPVVENDAADEAESVAETEAAEDAETDNEESTSADKHYRGKYVAKGKKPEEAVSWQVSILLYLRDLAKLLAVIVILFALLFRVVVVSGTSMNDTLYNGDYLLLLGDVLYRNPKQGDIIVASKASFDNGDPIVKRVIATEGQWVDINFEEGIVYVGDSLDNMIALDEPYTKTLTTRSEGVEFPLQVTEGHLFVLGDNRENSKDGRDPEIGLIDEREILGKVIFLFLPGTNYGSEAFDIGRIGVVK